MRARGAFVLLADLAGVTALSVERLAELRPAAWMLGRQFGIDPVQGEAWAVDHLEEAVAEFSVMGEPAAADRLLRWLLPNETSWALAWEARQA